MGTIVYTADDEPLPAHEGYVSAVLENGHSTHGTWTLLDTDSTVAWRAECSCGWAGPRHPCPQRGAMPTDAQYDAVLADWETTHARPLAAAQERVFELTRLSCALRLAEAKLREAVQRSINRGATPQEIARAIQASAAEVEQRYVVHPANDRPWSPIAASAGRETTGPEPAL
jgi:hypothetical protein